MLACARLDQLEMAISYCSSDLVCRPTACVCLSESDDILTALGKHQVKDLVPILDGNGKLVAGASANWIAGARRYGSILTGKGIIVRE
jgi:hypothetical protein